MKRKVCIVEDDMELNQTLSQFLRMSGFEVSSVIDGEEAIGTIYENSFDIILLDIKLPKINGFNVAKKIREFTKSPIIFITSLDGEKDMEEGFLSGGDDYIRKPFSLKELNLRIKAILRRVYGNTEIVEIGDNLIFDVINLELYKNSKKIHLKRKEAKLLKLFLENRNRILEKREILDSIYEYEEMPNENSMRTFIKTLRNIIGKNKIETIKDIGYKYVGRKTLFK